MNFDRLDTKVWKHDVTMSGGGNWEFEWYTNNRTNSYTKDGSLYLHPTLTADNIGAANVVNGYTHNIEGNEALVHCTDPGFFGCVRTSDGRNIINPIQSARISTVNSFSMKYGRIEVRAKLPVGDWLWPAIWMLPTDSSYGNWPASGEIDIMESRGNAPGGQQVGADTYGSTLHWGPSFGYNGYPKTHKEYKLPGGKTFADDFHTFGMEWTPEGIKTYVDDPANVVLDVPFTQTFWDKGGFPTSMKNPWEGACTSAPFDQEFHLVMNVAVGGTASYFPDTPNKPWKNTSPNAALDFWNARDQWLPTWKGDNVAMKIDSVKAWKLC
ncbi:putative glucan binding protein [Powellomyces hirtus]|nr:putative glucan binding protein [Powellomyces hirtus]